MSSADDSLIDPGSIFAKLVFTHLDWRDLIKVVAASKAHAAQMSFGSALRYLGQLSKPTVALFPLTLLAHCSANGLRWHSPPEAVQIFCTEAASGRLPESNETAYANFVLQQVSLCCAVRAAERAAALSRGGAAPLVVSEGVRGVAASQPADDDPRFSGKSGAPIGVSWTLGVARLAAQMIQASMCRRRSSSVLAADSDPRREEGKEKQQLLCPTSVEIELQLTGSRRSAPQPPTSAPRLRIVAELRRCSIAVYINLDPSLDDGDTQAFCVTWPNDKDTPLPCARVHQALQCARAFDAFVAVSAVQWPHQEDPVQTTVSRGTMGSLSFEVNRSSCKQLASLLREGVRVVSCDVSGEFDSEDMAVEFAQRWNKARADRAAPPAGCCGSLRQREDWAWLYPFFGAMEIDGAEFSAFSPGSIDDNDAVLRSTALFLL